MLIGDNFSSQYRQLDNRIFYYVNATSKNLLAKWYFRIVSRSSFLARSAPAMTLPYNIHLNEILQYITSFFLWNVTHCTVFNVALDKQTEMFCPPFFSRASPCRAVPHYWTLSGSASLRNAMIQIHCSIQCCGAGADFFLVGAGSRCRRF